MRAESPGNFSRLLGGQKPQYLWLGCSDARVPANVITGLNPGEVFVHRNVANVVHSTDLNLLSVLEFAIAGLGIRKIIVCGHHGCGGVQAAAEGCKHGLVEHWLEPIRRLHRRHTAVLATLPDRESRLQRLAELNVVEAVSRIAETPIVRQAWDNSLPIEVHGMIYALADGQLHRLDCSQIPGR